MASHIWLGFLKGKQENAVIENWFFPQVVKNGKATRNFLEDLHGNDSGAAIIAKGNIIEGIEAKE